MATGMHLDERSIDCLVLGHLDQDRKVSAKLVTMRAMTLCKNLSGYRELLLISKTDFAAIKYSGQGSFKVKKGTIDKLLFLLETIGIYP